MALLARVGLRRHRGTLLVLTGLVALVSAAVFTAAAGANRTATVIDRMRDAYPQPDVVVAASYTTAASDAAQIRAAEAALAELRGVRDVVAVPQIVAAVGPDDGSYFLGVATGLDHRFLESINVPVNDGRLPSVDGTRELAVDERTAAVLGLEVGDELVTPTLSVKSLGAALFGGEAAAPEVDGPELRFDVVGIVPDDLVGSELSIAIASPDTATYLGEAASSDVLFEVRGDPEAIDVDAAVAVAAEAVPGGATYWADPDAELEPVRNAADMIAAGLAVFAAVALVGGLLALGQVVGRQVEYMGSIAAVTRALGMRERTSALAVAVPSMLAAAGGVAIGSVIAVGLSPRFPISVARRAEVEPGVRVDWSVLVVGSVLLVLAVSAWALVAARHAHRSVADDPPASTARDSRLRRLLPVTVAVGCLSVVAPNRSRSGVRPGSAVVGAVLGVAGVLAIAVFAVSQHTTATDRTRYGWGWDVDTELTWDDPQPVIDALAEEPLLAGVGIAGCVDVLAGEDSSQLCAMQVVSGSLTLTYLAGRAPGSPDEVVLARQTLATRELDLGDTIEITSQTGTTRRLGIVGVVVSPDPSNPGRGIVTTPEGFEAFGDDEYLPILTLRYAPDVDRDVVEAALSTEYGLRAEQLTAAEPPELLSQLARVRPTLIALAGFLGLLGVIGLMHFLLLSARRSRRDSAVLRALGFVPSQTVAVAVWQAATIAVVGVVIGVPLGVIIGRSVWIESIDQLGIVDAPTTPWRIGALVVAGAVLGAAVAGAVPGWLASRRNPAATLREE